MATTKSEGNTGEANEEQSAPAEKAPAPIQQPEQPRWKHYIYFFHTRSPRCKKGPTRNYDGWWEGSYRWKGKLNNVLIDQCADVLMC